MIRPARSMPASLPALERLSRLAPLDGGDRRALQVALEGARPVRPRTEIVGEGQEVGEAKLIASGWAGRIRLLPDGRRQLLSFLLPGDVIGLCRHARPVALASIVALTEVTLCTAPPAPEGTGLAEAYATSLALEEAHLLAQIVRLGRLNAQERIRDLVLELYERLDQAGLVAHGGFEFPLTQEGLADALGLTSVHVNRMVQLMRREGELRWTGGRVTLPEPAVLARKLARTPARVSARTAL